MTLTSHSPPSLPKKFITYLVGKLSTPFHPAPPFHEHTYIIYGPLADPPWVSSQKFFRGAGDESL